MKKIIISFLIFGLLCLIPEINYASDENGSRASGEGSSENSGAESGKAIGIALVIVAVAAVVIYGASIWGGITTTKKSRKKKKDKENKEMAAAIFSEATKGYGDKTNIGILAKYYCCSEGNVIDTISKLSLEGRIDIDRSLVDDQTAGDSLRILAMELHKEAMNKNEFKQNLKTILANLSNESDLINKIIDIENLKITNAAQLYRSLFGQ